MAASVEVDVLLEVELGYDIVFGCCGREGGECCVEVVDIGLVVFGVVEGHDLSADVGFKGLEM